MKHHFAPLDRIRVSKKAQDQLVTLRRRTGLRQWNWLCRWAFCRSIAEPSKPPMVPLPSDSNLEMSWQVFGGDHEDIYAAILRQRCIQDGLGTETETLATQFRLHLQRGIGYLVGDQAIRSIGGLIGSVAPSEGENVSAG